MQVLNAPHPLTAQAEKRLQQELEDIVQRLEIQSALCIYHPDYQPTELTDDIIDRFATLPIELQHKYLNLQLRGFLYGIYYNGSLKAALASDAETKANDRLQDLENNTFLGVDLDFYQRLHASNQGEGYFASGWQVLCQEDDGDIAVTKGGLTIHLKPDQHLQFPDQAVAIGDIISIRMPRNLVQNGFYMAVGNLGLQPAENAVRAYLNLTSEGAVQVMERLTDRLNQQAIPFSLKALYNPSDYDRDDSAVLYFNKDDYPKIRLALQNAYQELTQAFRDSVPLFTKPIAPGIAIAEEPYQKFAEAESFGMNRCQIIANGLLEAWLNQQEAPEQRMAAIQSQFAQMGISLQRPYLNAGAADIYTELL